MDRQLTVEEEWSQTQEQVQAHYSSLTLHRKCPQAWYYRYGLKLYQPIDDPAPYLNYGSWFGMWRAAESLERGRKLESLKQSPRSYGGVGSDRSIRFDMRTVTTTEVEEAAAHWWRRQSLEVHEAWVSALGEGLPDRLAGGAVRWMDEWAEQRRSERPLGVEIFWERELPRPAGDREWEGVDPDSLPLMRLIGFIDEAYYDAERNLVVVRDVKTMKSLSTMTSFDDMMDSQLMLYAWGAAPQIAEWGMGPPRAVAYDRSRSVRASQPKLTLGGSLSLSVTDFDLQTYLEFASQDTRPEEVKEASRTGNWNLPFDTADWESLTDQQKALVELPPGQFWGEYGKFFVSGAKAGQPKFGVYTPQAQMIDKLSQPAWRERYQQRTLRPLSLHVVRAHLRAAVDSATDIWRTQKRVEETNEGGRNLSKEGCRWCDYAPLCRAQMVGGPNGDYELADYGLVGPDKATRLASGQLV